MPGRLARPAHRVEVLRVLLDRDGPAERRMTGLLGDEFARSLSEIRGQMVSGGVDLDTVEPQIRYGHIARVVGRCVAIGQPGNRSGSRGSRSGSPAGDWSDRLDSVLMHPLGGVVVFVVVMAMVFQAIFAGARPLMGAIDQLFGWLGSSAASLLPAGAVQSLVRDGLIGGVGAVLIFLPQILILFAIIAVLEDCGYMARAAFVMDRLLSRCGLSGRSFVPMLACFACAVPGIMAARVIDNRRDRIVTILVSPLMSCSARLPVYTLLISAFIPDRRFLGGAVGLQGLTLLALYGLGIVVALPMAWLFKGTVLRGRATPFLMEVPPFHRPSLKVIGFRMFDRGKDFLFRAGTIILVAAVVIWALTYFPRPAGIAAEFDARRAEVRANWQGDAMGGTGGAGATGGLSASADTGGQAARGTQRMGGTGGQAARGAQEEEAMQAGLDRLGRQEAGAYIRQSYLGRAGRAIEPAVRPLGWDWRMATAVLASFPAREVVVSALGTIYNVGSEGGEGGEGSNSSVQLQQAFKSELRPDGTPAFTTLAAIGMMVFTALCCQCVATLAMIKRETGSWRWPILTFSYMTLLAYLGALAVYQGGTALGF